MRCEYSAVFECDELEGDLWLKLISAIPFVPNNGQTMQLEIAGIQYYNGKVNYTEWYDDDQYLFIALDMDNRKLSIDAYKRLIKSELQECKWQICQSNTSYTTLDLIAEIRADLHKDEVSHR